MRILVTGGTGFVGSHAVEALVKDGHEVRLLARSPDRAADVLRPLGLEALETLPGDAGDPGAVRTALEGMDAVLHAAAVYSLDPRDNSRLRQNSHLAKTVLGGAAERGLDPIVYVSSYVALLPALGPVLGPDSPVGTSKSAYARSKAEGEAVARELQSRGAPVVSFYPGGVWGARDPNFGEQAQIATNILKGRTNLALRGGYPIVDVRDLAQAIARAVEPGRGPRRYMVAGTYVDYVDLIGRLGRATGRDIQARNMPLVSIVARLSDGAQRLLPFRIPWNFQGPQILAEGAPCDDSRAAHDLGFAARDLDETIRYTVGWLHEAGHISAADAGDLASG